MCFIMKAYPNKAFIELIFSIIVLLSRLCRGAKIIDKGAKKNERVPMYQNR